MDDTQHKLFELKPLPETKKRQRCKDCKACQRLNYFYQWNYTQSTAYYCGKKQSTRTKNGLQKLYYVGLSNNCSMFEDKRAKPEAEKEQIFFHSKGFFKQKIW